MLCGPAYSGPTMKHVRVRTSWKCSAGRKLFGVSSSRVSSALPGKVLVDSRGMSLPFCSALHRRRNPGSALVGLFTTCNGLMTSCCPFQTSGCPIRAATCEQCFLSTVQEEKQMCRRRFWGGRLETASATHPWTKQNHSALQFNVMESYN